MYRRAAYVRALGGTDGPTWPTGLVRLQLIGMHDSDFAGTVVQRYTTQWFASTCKAFT